MNDLDIELKKPKLASIVSYWNNLFLYSWKLLPSYYLQPEFRLVYSRFNESVLAIFNILISVHKNTDETN